MSMLQLMVLALKTFCPNSLVVTIDYNPLSTINDESTLDEIFISVS